MVDMPPPSRLEARVGPGRAVVWRRGSPQPPLTGAATRTFQPLPWPAPAWRAWTQLTTGARFSPEASVVVRGH